VEVTLKDWNKTEFENSLFAVIEANSKAAGSFFTEMAIYPFQSGGKRFRPMLMHFCSEDLGTDAEKILNAEIAVEILHTSSLIHDDLPSIDNDDFRRGRLAVHKVFGEGLAVTLADFLFFLSFQALSVTMKPELIGFFAQCSKDTSLGEALDIKFSEKGGNYSLEDILMMYEFKTARLIQFSLCAPAFFSDKFESVFQRLYLAGKDIGVAFQILDDIKDVLGTFEELGKTPKKDSKNNKASVLNLISLDKAYSLAQEYWESGLSLLKNTEEMFLFSKTLKCLCLNYDKIKKY